jgi:glycosyltransferase involved in cell wall biosynthesis
MRVYAQQLQGHLAAARGEGDEIAAISLPGARLQAPARYWDQYVRYQRLAKRTRADVHHILDHGFAQLASAMPPGRIVVSFHDAIPLRSGRASFGTRRTLSIGMRRAARRHARFIIGSEASRRDAQELFGIDDAAITLVPYGIEERFKPSEDRDALRARLGIRRPAVLIVGHTQPYMNVEGALRAAAWAAGQVDLEVIKIGAPLTVAQGAFAQQGALNGRLRERGIVSDAEIADWYAAVDALVYLPVMSGFGLPVLEAMASGTPVVTSAIGAVPEVAAGAALLVDPGDAQAAGEALARLLTGDPARGELIRLGRERAARYSWRRCADETMRVYREVADGA